MNRLSIDAAKLMIEAANSGVHYVEVIQNPEAHFQGFGTKLDQKKPGILRGFDIESSHVCQVHA